MSNNPFGLKDEIAASVASKLEVIEQRLHDAAVQQGLAHDFTDRVSLHLIDAGGKRVRPALTVLAAHLGDPERPQVLDAAVVCELTHLASLYHDDVMDSADTRRGAPAAHALWGNTIAILTGDLLFARASRVVTGLGVDAVRIQAETFERLCLGQLHETAGPGPDQDPVEHYLQVLSDKTGSLIATAGRFGAMFGGCDETTIEMLTQYGERVGVAFQLADDVIDLSADPAVTGKTPGTDLREHVPTMPVLLARRAAAQGDDDAHQVIEAIDGDLSDDAVLAQTVANLRNLATTQDALEQARAWAREAVAVIEPMAPGPVRSALIDFAGGVVDRDA